MDDERTKLSEEELKLIEETERFMEEVNSDPEVANAPLPTQLRENIFREIRAREAKKAEEAKENLSAEDKELIRLGKIYKKKRRLRKYYVLAAVLVLAMAFGVTSMGGPEKVFEKVSWFLAGREQTNVDSDDEDVMKLRGIAEEDAYQEIEEKFGFRPIRLDYLPEGVKFLEANIGEEIQEITLLYGKEEEVVLSSYIYLDYQVGSYGTDVEDAILEEYVLSNENVQINVKRYSIEDGHSNRWTGEFYYQDIYYFIMATDMDQMEFEKILRNLYFY